MKAAIITAALGLAVGLWWTQSAPTPVPEIVEQQKTRTGYTPPGRPEIRPGAPAKTLEPIATDDPQLRSYQDVLWRDLRTFATEQKLTDAQWERFQQDLADLARTESEALANGVRSGALDGFVELGDSLERELLVRCSEYMTKAQLGALRMRFLGLVTRVRQLHYVSTALPES